MGKGVRYLILVLVLAVCLAVAFGAYTVAGIAWDAVVGYSSPYASLSGSVSAEAPPVSGRVVLVVVDGLRLDAARRMPTLTAMSRFASDFVLTAPQPSLSYPNWTTIVSGAPPSVSGVVTNWHEGAAPVGTLFDSARSVDATYVVVGPEDLATLFPAVADADGTFMRPWTKEYMAATYVDAALELAESKRPRLLFVHIPDVDEAGHDFGGGSPEYTDTVGRVDADLRRLVEGLQDGQTTFVFVADHGHIDTGGHGGWEDDVVSVRGLFGGQGVNLGTGTAGLEDVAPTTAVLSGIPVPSHSAGDVVESIVNLTPESPALASARTQHDEFTRMRTGVVLGDQTNESTGDAIMRTAESDPDAALAQAEATRLSRDRLTRLPFGVLVAVAALMAIVLVGIASWRALVAAAVGTATYYLVYNVVFFVLHGYRWSLSAFNSEDLIESWMNMRMAETIMAGLFAALVAGVVYPLLRKFPMAPCGTYLPGWLTLGPATVLVTQATLALQVAWFVWWWGLSPEWRLQDLRWAFKADLDMVQMTALGAVALLAPIVTYLVGRYHPSMKCAPKAPE